MYYYKYVGRVLVDERTRGTEIKSDNKRDAYSRLREEAIKTRAEQKQRKQIGFFIVNVANGIEQVYLMKGNRAYLESEIRL